jgi:hypothetical protein
LLFFLWAWIFSIQPLNETKVNMEWQKMNQACHDTICPAGATDVSTYRVTVSPSWPLHDLLQSLLLTVSATKPLVVLFNFTFGESTSWREYGFYVILPFKYSVYIFSI